jgi:hypothetical protein
MALVVCVSCACHVRIGETVCPHCGVDLAVPGAARTPRRRSVEVRRVIVAGALAGLSTSACGGHIAGETTGTSVATEQDIIGTCTAPGQCDGTETAVLELADLPSSCTCGPLGVCTNSWCVSRVSCLPEEYLDKNGDCQTIYWFGGAVSSSPPSTHSCYGCPPPIG